MTVLACTSHVLVDLPLFGGPVGFVVGAILLIRRSERRRFAADEPAGDGAHVAGPGERAAVLQG